MKYVCQHYPTFKYFVNLSLIPKLFSKIWKVQTTLARDSLDNHMLNPLILIRIVPLKLSSGNMILLTITSKLRMPSQNIWSGVVGNVRINISPSNIFLITLMPTRFHPNCQSVLLGQIKNCIDLYILYMVYKYLNEKCEIESISWTTLLQIFCKLWLYS